MPIFTTKNPFGVSVTVNFAVDSQNGMDDLSKPISVKFSSPDSWKKVHMIRSSVDGILVGSKTILRDNPQLTCRLSTGKIAPNKQPLRIILDSLLETSTNHTVIKDLNPTLLVCVMNSDVNSVANHEVAVRAKNLLSAVNSHKQFYIVSFLSDSLMIDPNAILLLANKLKLKHLLVEGGPTTIESFITAGIVDRVIVAKSNHVKLDVPLLSRLDNSKLLKYGFREAGQCNWGKDDVKFWCKSGLQWPAGHVRNWP